MGFWGRVLNFANFIKRAGKKSDESQGNSFVEDLSQNVLAEDIPQSSPAEDAPQNENIRKLIDFRELMQGYLEQKHYLAKSDYAAVLKEYKPVLDFFDVLEQSGMMENFCRANRVTADEVRAAVDLYVNAEAHVDSHNDAYVALAMEEEKEYLDSILKDVDADILLDEDQRRVILTDEDYCLVIAGAGAGKTTTVAAKVKYLVDRQGVQPSQILVVSFTNKAVKELKEKIQDALGIDCPIATFHSTGNAILHKNEPEPAESVDEKTSGKISGAKKRKNSVQSWYLTPQEIAELFESSEPAGVRSDTEERLEKSVSHDSEPASQSSEFVTQRIESSAQKEGAAMQTAESSTQMKKPVLQPVEAVRQDDYVEIRRADLKPVMYHDLDLNEVIFTVVKALQNMSRTRYYGRNMLVDLLRGVENKEIEKTSLNKIPEFGALKNLPHETVCAILEWMITQHLILKTKERYPVLHSTYEGLHYSEKMTAGKLKGLKKYLEEEVVLWKQ